MHEYDKIKKAFEAELEAFEDIMDTSKFRELQRELELLATTDKLTGALNRWKFEDILEAAIEDAFSDELSFSLMIIDIDNFKRINDTHGHIQGDKVIEIVSKRIMDNLQSADSFGRYGGEEFIILFPHIAKEESETIGDSIQSDIKGHKFDFDDEITISVGVSEFKVGDDKCSMIDRADKLMYKDKTQRKQRKVVN